HSMRVHLIAYHRTEPLKDGRFIPRVEIISAPCSDMLDTWLRDDNHPCATRQEAESRPDIAGLPDHRGAAALAFSGRADYSGKATQLRASCSNGNESACIDYQAMVTACLHPYGLIPKIGCQGVGPATVFSSRRGPLDLKTEAAV